MANPNLIPALKLLVKDLSSSDLLDVLKAELGSKERLTTLQSISEWASTQLLDAPLADEHVGSSLDGLSHDNLYATLQKELGKEDRLGVLQCLVDWAVPDHVYAPATSITKVRFTGTVSSYDSDARLGSIECAEAQEIFDSEVSIAGDQLRRGPREGDKLSFAILRDAAHKPQAFDIINETLMTKDADRKKGKGERKGKGKKRPREVKEEEDDGEERQAVAEDAEESGRQKKKHGKGKGRKQMRKGEGKERDRGRDGDKARKGGDDGDRSRKGGEKGDKGSFKGGQKGHQKSGVFVKPPGAKGAGATTGMHIRPTAVVQPSGGAKGGVRPIGVSQLGLVANRLAALRQGGGAAAGQFGKGTLAQSLMRKNLLVRAGIQPRPTIQPTIQPHHPGGPIPAAGGKAYGRVAPTKGASKGGNKGQQWNWQR